MCFFTLTLNFGQNIIAHFSLKQFYANTKAIECFELFLWDLYVEIGFNACT